jgi:hypothetical protein
MSILQINPRREQLAQAITETSKANELAVYNEK